MLSSFISSDESLLGSSREIRFSLLQNLHELCSNQNSENKITVNLVQHSHLEEEPLKSKASKWNTPMYHDRISLWNFIIIQSRTQFSSTRRSSLQHVSELGQNGNHRRSFGRIALPAVTNHTQKPTKFISQDCLQYRSSPRTAFWWIW